MSDLYDKSYNPDVLMCLANLSNDEVFTPPEVVNAMLDMLPQKLFESTETTFLDPACKSGVFLREIAKRLIGAKFPEFTVILKEINKKMEAHEGLSVEESDYVGSFQKHVNHIMKNQLFGIAITEITSLLSRRSLYCSKYANGPFSVSIFDNVDGNIRFHAITHTWQNGNCIFCGASQGQYDREDRLEQHAYEWIHLLNPEEVYGMKWDVVVGNPPYQLSDGGGVGTSAMPIYHKFVQQAKKLMPRYISMIIPSRWFSGGRGLDDFREEMLNDKRIRELHDFFSASEVFPGVEIKGGVCYFLWNRDEKGLCNITTHMSNGEVKQSIRPLLENGMKTFLRNEENISILGKVKRKKESSFSDIVTANDPFGFDVRVEGSYKRVKPVFSKNPFNGAVRVYYNGWRKNGIGYIEKNAIRKGQDMIGLYKVFIPKAWGTGDPQSDWLNPFIVEPNSASTETYLTVGPFNDNSTAENAVSYMGTKFFHFMVSMIKITQNTMKNMYEMVPLQDFSVSWTDEMLYKKYELSGEEISFIESSIRTTENGGDEDGE